jgi:hypothetical protein
VCAEHGALERRYHHLISPMLPRSLSRRDCRIPGGIFRKTGFLCKEPAKHARQ